ncbi:uncharacterized protein LOC111044754 [Nilaparvata lugens]|uniref:uncharacterized protein LOC111044754 n=1 Tax=Nilaparvata lugens TaxID=108931 RepID=UPI00193E4D2E|nr:uncharacterized protein LOC111044754 [Nilaparvata lugens]
MKDIEYCYDDNAFGRCIGTFGNVEEDDLYRYDFAEGDLGLLEKEMNRLKKKEYHWSSTYTQCILQAVLFALKSRTVYDRSVCNHLIKNQDPAIEAIQNEVEMDMDPRNMAYVKFTPSRVNPHADFADEVYMPPLTPEEVDRAVAIRMEEEEENAALERGREGGALSEGVLSYNAATRPELPVPPHFGTETVFAPSNDLKTPSRPLYKALLQKKAPQPSVKDVSKPLYKGDSRPLYTALLEKKAPQPSVEDASRPLEEGFSRSLYSARLEKNAPQPSVKDASRPLYKEAPRPLYSALLEKKAPQPSAKEVSRSLEKEASRSLDKEASRSLDEEASTTFKEAFRRAAPTHFRQDYNTPDNFRSGQETKDKPAQTVVEAVYPAAEDNAATRPELPVPPHFGTETVFAPSNDLKTPSRPLYKALLQKKAPQPPLYTALLEKKAPQPSVEDASRPLEEGVLKVTILGRLEKNAPQPSVKDASRPLYKEAPRPLYSALLEKKAPQPSTKEVSRSLEKEASRSLDKEASRSLDEEASTTFKEAFRRAAPTHFRQDYNTPDNFRSGQETKDKPAQTVVEAVYPAAEGFGPLVDLDNTPNHFHGIRNSPGLTAEDLTNPMFRKQRHHGGPHQLSSDPRGYPKGPEDDQEEFTPQEIVFLRQQSLEQPYSWDMPYEDWYPGMPFQVERFPGEEFSGSPEEYYREQIRRTHSQRKQLQMEQPQRAYEDLFPDIFSGKEYPEDPEQFKREPIPEFVADQAPMEQISLFEDQVPVGFNQDYNTPDKFRHGFETRDSFPAGREASSNSLMYGLDYQKSLNEPQPLPDLEPRGYTEGGMVYLPDKSGSAKNEEEAEEEALSEILSDLDPAMGWGFKRRERLDVKKPGPLFSTNNYAFKTEDEQKMKKAASIQDSSDDNKDKEALSKEMLQEELMESNSKPQRLYKLPYDLVSLPNKKELPKEDHLDPAQYDVVDTNYAYIGFQDSVREWKDGKRIVNAVARLLHIPPDTFTNIRVDRNEVTFKVSPKHHTPGINASEVARMIVSIKDRLKREIGVTVTTAGVGDKAKLPAIMSLVSEADHNLYVFSFILIGVVGAVVISAAALYVIRRHAASREKLQNLTAPDTEASKDYQELCRARMATKPAQEASPAAQRIASLSRESDNSPSSRSSTSSWCEEPALTNMDISTGHMVLSYMEDHLRNKDRLEQEWTALCAYEAEPCASTIAQRVCFLSIKMMLNTDHDPRNPAYIATQGPLSNTTPDLWQMVWEQGCVVMVMLTRLVESDVTMCHRYWPEEGSELYHIYEVHLVSEHIWCDDYLVRSFYLKNLKTGETRTVTQFHFLSWPDGGVPSSIKALLEFRRKVNKSFRGRSCPIVVHCSDGIGRTGTYCLLDMVLNRMAKGAKEIDIAATLEHIRDQRMRSVTTKQQFQFVLAAVAEEVQAILRVLPTAKGAAGGGGVGGAAGGGGGEGEKEKKDEKGGEKEK